MQPIQSTNETMQRLGVDGRGRMAIYAVLSLFLWMAMILPRGLGWHSVSESLWTEDSTIFLNQAYQLGAATLWTCYQGYLHTFQRLFCLLVAQFPLAAVPYLLCAGWCLTFVAMVYVLDHRLRRRGFTSGWVMLVLALIALQPSGGEVYFSITNTQWVLGLALALYVCLPEPDPERRIELLPLGVACLTGPFSILLMPVLCAQIAFRRDLSTRWRTYAIFALGAAVQLAVLLNSNRLSTPVATGDTFASWASAALTFLTYGAKSALAFWLAIALWIVTCAGLLRNASQRKAGSVVDALSLFGAGALLFGVSIYSVSLWSSVTSISPLSGGGRYYFIPYSLVFAGALLTLRASTDGVFRALPWIYAAAALAMCGLLFNLDRREDLQWPAFARFASAHQGVEIPINPPWNLMPTWKVVPPVSKTTRTASATAIPVEPSQAGATGVVFSLREHCPDSRTVGVEAQVLRNQSGYAMLEWGSGSEAAGRSELKRFYPAGPVTLQFAFTKGQADTAARLVPLIGSTATVNRMTVFCL